MAEGGVMSLPFRWYVLPPAEEADDWRRALLQQASAQGVPVVEVLAGTETVPHGSVGLAQDLDVARLAGAQPADTVVLLGSPFVGLEGCEDGQRPFRILDVTRKIAAAHSFEGQRVRLGLDRLPEPFANTPTPERSERPLSPLEDTFRNALRFLDQGRAQWSPAVFHYAGWKTVSDSVGVVDITGRPRLVVFGPYIFLTPGVWRATIRLGFDQDAAPKRYEIHWGSGDSYAAHEFSPGRAGLFEIALEHEWPRHEASEARLFLHEGAFHGQVHFHGATIERISD